MKTLDGEMEEAWRARQLRSHPYTDRACPKGWGSAYKPAFVDGWEAAAKAVAAAVRAETIEECAKLCDTETAIPGRYCAAAIRSLALEAK